MTAKLIIIVGVLLIAYAINASGDTWAHVNLGRHRAEVLAKHEKTEEDFAKALKGTSYKVTGFEQAEA